MNDKYYCKCCDYNAKVKSSYLKHLKTNKHLSKMEKFQNVSEMYPKCIQMYPNVYKMYPNVSEKVARHYNCKYCGKKFKYSQGLSKHVKYTCKHNNDEDLKELVRLLNEQTQTLSEENQQKDEQIKNIQQQMERQQEKMQRQIERLSKKLQIQQFNTISNSNNKIVYNINNYVDTDYSHLTPRDYLKCFKDTNHCVKTLIEKVHMNNKKPENMNIYIPFLKDNYIMVYKNNEWTIQNRNEIIDNLYTNNEYQLENWYDEFSEKHPEIVESFTRYLKNKENDSVVNDVKKLLLMEFYNKRNIILENRKKQGLNSMLDE